MTTLESIAAPSVFLDASIGNEAQIRTQDTAKSHSEKSPISAARFITFITAIEIPR